MKTNTNYLTLETPKRHPRFFLTQPCYHISHPPSHHLYLSIYPSPIHPSLPPHFRLYIYIYPTSSARYFNRTSYPSTTTIVRAAFGLISATTNASANAEYLPPISIRYTHVTEKLDSAFRTHQKKTPRPAATVTENLDLLLSSLAPLASPRRPAGSDTAVCRRRRLW